MRRAPLMLVASGKPFEYPQTDWGDAVQMIGPCMYEPAMDARSRLAAKRLTGRSSWSQRHRKSRPMRSSWSTAMTALADEPVHVVATLPAGLPSDVTVAPNATVFEFVPHGPVLDRAVCAVTHGGMGATKRLLPAAFRYAWCRLGVTSSRSHGAWRWPTVAPACRRRS